MNIFHKRASSTVEYAALIIILIATVLAMQKYIVRGIAGRFKQAGDTFGYIKQYDPNHTLECTYSEAAFRATGNGWSETQCFMKEKKEHFSGLYMDCYNTCSRPKIVAAAQSFDACGGPDTPDCYAGYKKKFWEINASGDWVQVEYKIYDTPCCHYECDKRCDAQAEVEAAQTPACQDPKCSS